MRVFKNLENIEELVAREMFNIETGMLYFDPLSSTDVMNDKPPLYPMIEADGIKTSIRSAVGFIYVPNDIPLKDFMEDVEDHLDKLDEKYHHLDKHARVDRKAGQFSAMKVKSSYSKNEYYLPGKNAQPNHCKRCFILDTPNLKIAYDMSKNRFHWFIFPSKVLIKNIEQFENPRFPPTTQFVSIVYDKHDQILVDNGVKLETNLTFTYFRVCKNLVSFRPLETLVEEELANESEKETAESKLTEEELQAYIESKKCYICQKTFKSKGGLTRHANQGGCSPPEPDTSTETQTPAPQYGPDGALIVTPPVAMKPCPFCKRNFKTAGSVKTHMKKCKMATSTNNSLAKAEVQKDNMVRFLNMNAEEKKKHLERMGGHPEYMPQWNDVVYDENHGLALCPKRGAAFELIRYFGKWDIYRDAFSTSFIPLKKIPALIYHEEFHNIIIDQSYTSHINGNTRGFFGIDGFFGTENTPNTRKQTYPEGSGFADDEICSCCYTPLYGDIYVVIPNKKAIAKSQGDEGYAVCAVCMHYNYTPHVNDTTILRVAYPSSVSDIIAQTNFIPLKKNILRKAFNYNLVDVGPSGHTAFIIGYKPNVGRPNSKPNSFEYIGWTGFLSDFINYMDTDNKLLSSVKGAENIRLLQQIIGNARVFPAKLIN